MYVAVAYFLYKNEKNKMSAIVITTELGVITLALRPDSAPVRLSPRKTHRWSNLYKASLLIALA